MQILDGPAVEQALSVIAKKLPGYGAALRDLRRQSGLTQKQITTRLGVSETALSTWENGKHAPTLKMIRKTLQVMNVDARLVSRYFGEASEYEDALDGLQPYATAKAAALKIADLILKMPDRETSEVEAVLWDRFTIPVIAIQLAKSLAGDSKAAALVLQRSDRLRPKRRRNGAPANLPAGECAAVKSAGVPGRIV